MNTSASRARFLAKYAESLKTGVTVFDTETAYFMRPGESAPRRLVGALYSRFGNGSRLLERCWPPGATLERVHSLWCKALAKAKAHDHAAVLVLAEVYAAGGLVYALRHASELDVWWEYKVGHEREKQGSGAWGGLNWTLPDAKRTEEVPPKYRSDEGLGQLGARMRRVHKRWIWVWSVANMLRDLLAELVAREAIRQCRYQQGESVETSVVAMVMGARFVVPVWSNRCKTALVAGGVIFPGDYRQIEADPRAGL